jgi:glycosyltransferase involved in cell wall biosynthesis
LDKRVRFYTNEKNIGLCGNFNKCLSLAEGELIKFLCADDKFHNTLLEKFVKIMDEYPNVSLVTSNKEIIGPHDPLKYKEIPFSYLHGGWMYIKT